MDVSILIYNTSPIESETARLLWVPGYQSDFKFSEKASLKGRRHGGRTRCLMPFSRFCLHMHTGMCIYTHIPPLYTCTHAKTFKNIYNNNQKAKAVLIFKHQHHDLKTRYWCHFWWDYGMYFEFFLIWDIFPSPLLIKTMLHRSILLFAFLYLSKFYWLHKSFICVLSWLLLHSSYVTVMDPQRLLWN